MCQENDFINKIMNLKLGKYNLSMIILSYLVGYLVDGRELALMISLHMTIIQFLEFDKPE